MAKFHSSKRNILIILAGLITIVAITIFVVQRKSSSGIPKSIEDAATFPLYYPQQLPPGLKLNPHSFSGNSDVVTYDFSYSDNKQLLVSVQPLGRLDISTFNPTTTFTTYIGTAYIADLSTRTTAAVIGSKSWVLINAPGTIPSATLTSFINDLEPVKGQ